MHKQSLKNSSHEVYQALKAIEWRAKSCQLASDQGLNELNGNKTQHKGKGICASVILAILCFSLMAALCYVININEVAIKVPLAVAAFLVGLVIGLTYFFCFLRS